jgi:dienelactone hydrolase
MTTSTPEDTPVPSCSDRSPRVSSPRGLSRRALLRTGAVAGGSLVAAASVPGVAFAKGPKTAGTAATAPITPAPPGLMFFADTGLDFNARFALGAAGYHCADVGEVITAINATNSAGASYTTFVDAFSSLADRTGAYASQARTSGQRVTAREAHLRAAEYYAQALFFVLGTADPAREQSLYAAGQRHWVRACALFDPPILTLKIPYEDTVIPAYLLRPDDTGEARPTVIVNNGSDAQTVETFAYGGAAAIERGWNALMFEGPGQGAMLFQRQIPFRPDWEKVITPIVDFLRDRDDVDNDRIALTGWSMGGELVVRAAAFEPRLAAVVADPGSYDEWLAWPQNLREVADAGDDATVNQIWQNEILPALTPSEAFDIKKRSEIFAKEFLDQARKGEVLTDFAKLASTVREFQVSDVLDKVNMPILVTDYELDQFVPGQAQELYTKLPRPKDYVEFTTSQGAEYHCAPMAPQFRNEIVFNWLDRTVNG